MFSLRSINYLIAIGSYLALVDTFEESIKGLFCTILIPNKNLQRGQSVVERFFTKVAQGVEINETQNA